MLGLLPLINPNEFLLCITHRECAGPCSALPEDPQGCAELQCDTCIQESFTELLSQQFISTILLDPDLCK